MPIEFPCPRCGALLRASDSGTEATVRCHECRADALVPTASADELPHALPVDDNSPAKLVGAPRARTEPRAPKRRKWPLRYRVAAWLAFAFGVVVLVVGIGYALLQGETWHRHESPEGFAVDVPCPLIHDTRRDHLPREAGKKTERGELWPSGVEFGVIRIESESPDKRRSDQFITQDMATKIRNEPTTRAVVREAQITVSGFHAVELEYVNADGTTHMTRIVVAYRRVFIVVAGGGAAGDPRVRRFLDSFEITDDTLVGGTAHKRKLEALAGKNPVPNKK